jgi:triosephosphate isomerase
VTQKRLTDREIDAIARKLLEGESNTAPLAPVVSELVRRKLVVGNWKMNPAPDQVDSLLRTLKTEIGDLAFHSEQDPDVAVAPPLVYLERASNILGGIRLAAQNVCAELQGAFTGEVSVTMLKDAGTRYVILGHSERRALFGETGSAVARKALICLQNDLIPIVCVGETLKQREGDYLSFLREQLLDSILALPEEFIARMVLAYEPVWAIGTGKTATSQQASEVHHFLRRTLEDTWGREIALKVRILYGGSVTECNAEELLHTPGIDGALVGGASLDAARFAAICAAGRSVEFNA